MMTWLGMPADLSSALNLLMYVFSFWHEDCRLEVSAVEVVGVQVVLGEDVGAGVDRDGHPSRITQIPSFDPLLHMCRVVDLIPWYCSGGHDYGVVLVIFVEVDDRILHRSNCHRSFDPLKSWGMPTCR